MILCGNVHGRYLMRDIKDDKCSNAVEKDAVLVLSSNFILRTGASHTK